MLRSPSVSDGSGNNIEYGISLPKDLKTRCIGSNFRRLYGGQKSVIQIMDDDFSTDLIIHGRRKSGRTIGWILGLAKWMHGNKADDELKALIIIKTINDRKTIANILKYYLQGTDHSIYVSEDEKPVGNIFYTLRGKSIWFINELDLKKLSKDCEHELPNNLTKIKFIIIDSYETFQGLQYDLVSVNTYLENYLTLMRRRNYKYILILVCRLLVKYCHEYAYDYMKSNYKPIEVTPLTDTITYSLRRCEFFTQPFNGFPSF
uniref:Packaging ATPase n=1 Tax=Parastrongyloides trichosuri TaxID=131310 RepID=A0A0N4ZJ36_PARTI